MEHNIFQIFLIWLIPASIELSIAFFLIKIVKDAERRSFKSDD